MQKLKGIDCRILAALIRNSKMSDRQLAKEIGVSQPTVTRRRAKLEKTALDGYTAVLKWAAVGFEILAITMIKSHAAVGLRENVKANIDAAVRWMMKQPNVILCSGSRGMGKNGVMISVHKSYADFDKFMSEHKRELGDLFLDVESAIVNLAGGEIIKPLHLKYLAEGI